MSAGGVVVSPAGLDDKPAIAGLFQFYVYDFSAFEEAGSDSLDFEPDGRFGADPWLDHYWTDADRTPLIVRVGGKLAGFVLLNLRSHNGSAIDHNIAEFFIARKFRRGGVGGEVLRQISEGRPGRWEAAIMERNLPAKGFWPMAIAALPGVREITTTQGDGVAWRGPIMHFTIG